MIPPEGVYLFCIDGLGVPVLGETTGTSYHYTYKHLPIA